MRAIVTTLAVAVLLVAASTSLGVASFVEGQETTEAPDLDLREANVVNVTVDGSESVGDGGARTFDFSVTLYHDDDGESGYADRWQVEALNGTLLGQRDLLHAHGTRPFTRSERVEVPGDVSLVVVRGHDQTHGYGGQATVVDLRTGATETLRQGPERRDFGECEVVRGENATARTTTVPTTTGTEGTDLVRCPWEEGGTATTTG